MKSKTVYCVTPSMNWTGSDYKLWEQRQAKQQRLNVKAFPRAIAKRNAQVLSTKR